MPHAANEPLAIGKALGETTASGSRRRPENCIDERRRAGSHCQAYLDSSRLREFPSNLADSLKRAMNH